MAEPALRPTRDSRAWPAQGEWTYKDYCRLPDDGNRYEVIRGVLYVSPAPTTNHQRTVSRLLVLIGQFLLRSGLGEVLSAPYDVILPRRIASPVQPDLVVFRTGNLPQEGTPNFKGVPDLIVEVLSPRTRRLDVGVKLGAYLAARVPEVWHPDPVDRTIVVYALSQDGKEYLVHARGGVGEEVTSRLFPGLRIPVGEIFRLPGR
jgi:Uma2 family endonuclease